MVSINLDIAKEGMKNWKTHQKKKKIIISTLKIEEKKRHTPKKSQKNKTQK